MADMTWLENPMPGDLITFDRLVVRSASWGPEWEGGPDAWWPYVEDRRVPQAGAHRVLHASIDHPRELFASKPALVVGRMPWEAVHLYDRNVGKYWGDPPLVEDGNGGWMMKPGSSWVAPTVDDTHYPRPDWDWLRVCCGDRLMFAARHRPLNEPELPPDVKAALDREFEERLRKSTGV